MTGAATAPPNGARTDVLVVGAGVAGCAAALAAARTGAEVTVVTKASRPADANTYWAQGGVAVATEDSASFRRDVLAAADGEADPEAVEALVSESRDAVADVLVDTLGVPFDRAEDRTGTADPADARLDALARCREGGHSADRIVHVDASTGSHLLPPFLDYLDGLAGVRLLQDTAVLDLLGNGAGVDGALLERGGETGTVAAGSTVLATGGIGACYGTSTNPDGATGDGIAMAALAGATVADAAYVQFHPTAFPGGEAAEAADVDGDADPFLVSEAVRGAGAVLRNADGERFMPAVHEDAELAPRDVVARAVADERRETGSVVLDVDGIGFADRFPDLASMCAERGLDPSTGIPVAPAQHFLCGGVAVDERGRASIDRLFAVGECSRTGVHGANRLASTGLLEGLVWGLRAGETAAAESDPPGAALSVPDLPSDDPELPTSFEAAKFDRLRRTMDERLGVERTRSGVRNAAASLRRLKGEVDAYARTRRSRELSELRNAVVCGLLIARDAAESPSAGCHRLVDGGVVETDGAPRSDGGRSGSTGVRGPRGGDEGC
ncbi:aspartate oxidase [Halorubrum sp. Ea1]|uniref:L-aspartate oxidase n=1 Tax=Halorubrum sp. Ea1 TaxID=1480718 RepID=UPI000B9851BE|nr:FAD-dependent oxidoreductase [Halorubrum sp. Ea1]OYR52653.1 aspartate oxidase [Halorubrum sp. Ea1]